MFLLDTNVISELRVGKRSPSSSVRRWAAGVPVHQLYLSVVTLLELEMGVLLMERRDPRQGEVLRVWLRGVLDEFSSRILDFGTQTAVLCAALHVPDPRPERDAMVAATALVHGMAVVTRNVGDFAGTGVRVIDPWMASA